MTYSTVSQVEAQSTVSRKINSGRLPSLDGLRAVSICLVFLGHLVGTSRFLYFKSPVGDYAHLGVVVFFVISGYLITGLMLSEVEKYGSVSLKLFYARRALRLFPAAYVFIACVCVMWYAGIVHLQARDVWHAVTYTVNCETGRSWNLGHLWSLAVEEQFYLIWPCTFVLLGRRNAGWVAAGAVLLGPIARVDALLLLKGTPYRDLEMFPMVADSIATGCLLAMTQGWLEKQNWYMRLFRPAYSIGLLGLILLLNRFMDYGVFIAFGTSIINVCLAVLIHRSVYCSEDLVARILNWKPIAFVGVLSYSLYLWQQIFLNRTSAAWPNAFPENLIFAVGAALTSYFLLEKPLLNLRHKLRARTPKLESLSLCLKS